MPQITVLMPCLDEESNIAFCIQEAAAYIRGRGVSGGVLVVDNGSTDPSAEIAEEHGAEVIVEPRRGYGCALRTGLAAAEGDVIILGDCDSTYDFAHLDPIYGPLAAGEADLMVGDRFAGQMERGAMSLSHRLGVSLLSWCGRKRFGVQVNDWHCGLRGIRKDALAKLELRADGMEFATELIAEAARKGLRIGEAGVSLRASRFPRVNKLRTVRDGLRHLRYIVRG